MGFNRYIFSAVGASFLILAVFGVLRWMDIPAGRFLDWIIGVASFWWLLMIVTLPWNLYFKAREVMTDATQSASKDIKLDENKVSYVNNLAKRSLALAVLLHILSALGLYVLAAFQISAVGYVSAGAALLLTGLRPAVRAHEYIVRRLYTIGKEFRYPREDIVELRGRVNVLEEDVKTLKKQTDPNDQESLVFSLNRNIDLLRRDLSTLRVIVENLRVENQSEHAAISKEARQAVAKITEDGRFLENVREIIRFVKNA